MFLSVIVPAYNAEKYITRNLESLYKQNFNDMEVIVVNDGSTDSTQKKIEDFIDSHTKLNVKLINTTNQGLANARNTGIKEAVGDYFINLDSDDFLKENIVKKLYEKSKVVDYDICMYGFEDYDEESMSYKNPYDDKYSYIESELDGQKACLEKMSRKIWICQGNACYKRKMIIENKIFNVPGINQGEDLYFIIRSLIFSKIVTSIPEIGVSISYRKDSMMHSKFNLSHLEIFKVLSMLKNDIEGYDFLVEKNQIYNYIESEFEIQRLAIAKKIIDSKSLIHISNIISDINRYVPSKSQCRNLEISKSKKLESKIFSFNKIIYILLVKIYILLKI